MEGAFVSRGFAMFVSICLLSISVVSASASAQPTESVETLSTKLPWTLEAGTAVSIGTAIYLIGGFRGGYYSDRITRFDPVNLTFTNETARLPLPLVGVAGVWTGTEILMFGGQTESVNDVNFTLRFNPATGAIRNGTNLTSSRAFSPTVWTGRYVYIFGGTVGAGNARYDVLRYDSEMDRVDVVTTASIPIYTKDATATWDGTRATLFGGGFIAPGGGFAVMTFDPATERLSYVNGTGFKGVEMGSSAQIGRYAYVFGGLEANVGIVNLVQRLRTGSTEGAQSPANLSRPLALTTAAVVGDRAYIFGGWTGGFSDTNQIQMLRSTESSSPVLWIGIVGAIVAAVAITVTVLLLRRKRARRTQPPGAVPPTGD